MRLVGLLVIFAGLLTPLIWLPSISQGRDVIALFSQYLGMTALIGMAFGQIIATRWPGIEALFGAMDQSYRLHKWLGIGSMVALLLHDIIDAEMTGLGAETLLVETAETAGEISLYALLILVVITIATFIPYHLWKWTHRLIGLFFVMGAFHYIFILKPFANSDPLGIYMLAVCSLGTLAYIYTSAPIGLRRTRSYEVAEIRNEGSAMAIELKAKGRPIRHRAGQFAFFTFADMTTADPHAFTISNAPNDNDSLRLTVAPIGDMTSRLSSRLRVGQTVRVDGAYGRFGSHARAAQTWVAAGIVITPFVALAQALETNGPNVHLIYSVRTKDAAAHLGELEEIARRNPNFKITLWISSESGRLSAETLAEICGEELASTDILFCGAAQMRRDLQKGLVRFGVNPRKFHFEEFEIRTGIGLRRLALWLWNKRLVARS